VQCKIIKTNIFTPNGDGINDYFKLLNLDDYPTAEVKIYNRWGTLVYESDAYKNDWDGGNLKTGTYFYLVTPNSKKFIYDADAKEELKQTIKGYIQLMR
jgi:gliding motility-associated-like protein